MDMCDAAARAEEAADRGSVAANGKVVDRVGPDRVMVFQEPRLLPWLTVWKSQL